MLTILKMVLDSKGKIVAGLSKNSVTVKITTVTGAGDKEQTDSQTWVPGDGAKTQTGLKTNTDCNGNVRKRRKIKEVEDFDIRSQDDDSSGEGSGLLDWLNEDEEIIPEKVKERLVEGRRDSVGEEEKKRSREEQRLGG